MAAIVLADVCCMAAHAAGSECPASSTPSSQLPLPPLGTQILSGTATTRHIPSSLCAFQRPALAFMAPRGLCLFLHACCQIFQARCSIDNVDAPHQLPWV
ncbi:hypothetical protein ABPG75_013573 [Micractinium tetrahymenae]